MSDFKQTLVATLRAIRPLFSAEGVRVIGSQVPNLLRIDSASLPIVSRDVDIGVPVDAHAELKRCLKQLATLRPSQDEPSVWVGDGVLEVNFVGIDASLTDPTEVRVLEDVDLPLIVFGALSLLSPGSVVDIEGTPVPIADAVGLALEKLLTERSGVKGDRDLLVVLGLIPVLDADAITKLVARYAKLSSDLRHQVRNNLAILSLVDAQIGMPDPKSARAWVLSLLREFERAEEPT